MLPGMSEDLPLHVTGGHGRRPGTTGDVVATITQSGRLDFLEFQSSDVLSWLHAHEQWPEGMPLTTSREHLQSSAAEERGRRLVEEAQDHERR